MKRADLGLQLKKVKNRIFLIDDTKSTEPKKYNETWFIMAL